MSSHAWPALAERVVDELLTRSPLLAQDAGDHRVDDRLPDWSAATVAEEVATLRAHADALAEVDDEPLDAEDRVDLQLLASAVDARLFALTETREHEWDPLLHNPGELLFALLARDYAPPAERLVALAGRLAALPDAVATARSVLVAPPRIHVETALGQLAGTEALVRDQAPALLAREPSLGPVVEPAREVALAALAEHRADLTALLDGDGRDHRLGRPQFEAKLWHALDSDLTAATVRARAESSLAELSDEIAEVAEELTGNRDARSALALLARDHPDDSTIVPTAAAALARTTEFVRTQGFVSLYDDPVEVIVMPEFARGVAVAYCDVPGELEPVPLPTFLAISPTPADWPPERVASFYREYNDHLVDNLMVHEAMPGHYLQMAHSRRFRGSSRVRAVCRSGPFVEGWAVYAEQLMVDAGYGGLPVRMQQLKMKLRMVINALLDQLVHCEGGDEADAMALMTGRGFQEEGEAAGKWRRAQLTSTQLSTYFVGHAEVSEIAAARPTGTTPRAWHDAMLAHGSPPPRHLRTLLAE